jgi:hypothetical protein
MASELNGDAGTMTKVTFASRYKIIFIIAKHWRKMQMDNRARVPMAGKRNDTWCL